MATRGNSHFGDEVMDATRQILKIGSAMVDVAKLTAEVGREVPIASAVLKVFIVIHEKVEMVRTNKEDLEGLRDRCRYLTACVVEECRRHPMAMNVTPLEAILRETTDVIKRRGERKGMRRVLKATRDKDEIQSLNLRLDQLGVDMGLAATIRTLKLIDQAKHQSNKRAAPQGVPIRKSWYVDRQQIVQDVYERLCRGESPKLVALVGDSGSGKTTVAAEIAMDSRVRDFFSDGIVWLSADDGASDRLPSLMARLAGMVNKNMSRDVREDIINSCSGAEYIKQRMELGRQGKGLTCLVVADNVWESEVIRELRKTGMWILVTTRDRGVVKCSANDSAGTVDVGEMFGDAELVLKRSSDLADDDGLPVAAMKVAELCGRVAMELAFVGSWDLVYQRKDSHAWNDAVDAIIAELPEVNWKDCSAIPRSTTREIRRKAIFNAGFKQLDNLHQTLYMSLAVMPDGHAFTVDNAAILLYGQEYSGDDKAAAKQVVENLERWSVLGSYNGLYKMHGAHAATARNKIENNKELLHLALARIRRGAQYHALDINISRNAEDIVALAIAISDIKPEASGEVEGLMGRVLESLGDDNSQVATIMDRFWVYIGSAGCYNEAAAGMLRKGLAIKNAKPSDDDTQVAVKLHELGVRLREDGRYDDAEMVRKGLRIEKAKPGKEALQVAVTLQSLGMYLRDSCRYDRAENTLRKALAIERANVGEDDLQVAATLHELGVCLCDNGRNDEAEGMLRKALKIKQAKLGEHDLQAAVTLNELGVCLRNNGQYDEAEDILREALTIENTKLGEDDLQVAITLQALGVCLRNRGWYDRAEEVLNQVLASQKTKLGGDDQEVAYTLHCLGVCIRDSGRPEEAEPLLRQDLKITETKKVDDDIEISVSQIQLATCLREMGKLNEADKLFELSSERIETKHMNNESMDAALARLRLGLYAWRSGMQERAARLLRRALSVTDATDLEKDVSVVAERLHKYSVIRGIKFLKEEAEGLLSYILGIDEHKAREGWLASQYSFNLMATE